MLRAALESQPPVEPKQIVDDVIPRLEESNLETTDDAVVETTVPPRRTTRAFHLQAPREDPQVQAQREMIERAAERNWDLAAALEHANSRLAEVENEREALQSRPTAKQYAEKLSEISTLEKKLSDVQGKARTHERALRRYAGTKELVRRDRLDYALDLKSLDAMPKNVAVDVVREVCRDLRLSDRLSACSGAETLCCHEEITGTGPPAKKGVRYARRFCPGGGPLPLEAALDALEASKLSKSDQVSL